MPENRSTLPLASRAAPVATINADTRTFTLCWSTGAGVRRYDWRNDRYYTEVLEISDAAVDLSRLNAAAPLLDTHSSWNLGDILGVVERAWLENGQGMSEVRFSERAEVDGIWSDVKSGVIRNVSIGYSVEKMRMEQDESGAWIYTATRWTPLEVSLVPIPADIGAGTRSQSAVDAHGKPLREFPVEIMIHQRNTPEVNPAAAADIPPNSNEVRMDKTPEELAAEAAKNAAAAATANERARVAGINTAVRSLNLEQTLADDYIARGLTLEAANAEIITALAARSNAAPVRNANVQMGAGEVDHRRSGLQEALQHRANPGAVLTDNGRRFRGMRLIDMARECVESAGGNTRGYTSFEIAGMALGLEPQLARAAGMQSSGDFSFITANTINRTLRDHYESAGQTFWPLVNRATATDFKDKYIVRMGGQLKLEKLGEHGEYKYGSVSDAGEKYAIETYGKIIAVTRKTLVNDDLDAFSRIPRFFAQEAADLESDLVWGLITGNPVMADAKTLFHADHANKGGAAALGEASLSELRQLLALQKNESGKPMNLQGNFLLCPVAQMTSAQKLLTAVAAVKTGDVNVFQNAYTPIFEARLDAVNNKGFYLAAGPSRTDTIEIAYLEGQEGLYTETREGFAVDGIEIKARLDVGAGLGDFRWITRNDGA